MKFPLVLLALASLALPLRSPAEDVIRVGNLKFVHYGTIAYMKEIAPRYGLRIEEKIYAKGIDMLPELMQGTLDLAASAAEGAIEARAAGAPIYIVAGFAAGGARIVGRSDEKWKGSASLKGKRIGVARGSAQQMLLLAELATLNFTPSTEPGRDVQIVYLPFAKLNEALEKREVDAVCHSEPQASQAITKGFGVDVTKPYKTVIGEPVRALTMSEKLYQNRALALRVMTCFVDATKTFLEQPQLASKYVRETFFAGKVSEEDYRLAFENARFTYDVNPAQIEAITDFMIHQKLGVVLNVTNRPTSAVEWVRTDLLTEARVALGVVPTAQPGESEHTLKTEVRK
ncbi:MAG: ABC transporter substrate-binding protein [Verrucomicrobia bacterium]|nr:ABC transporter substrate-binding protein [Verrucomicrobiota bacterium]